MSAVHIPFNPELFRRNPKLGIGLGLILVGIAGVGLFVEYSDYRSLGNQPQIMTIEQAVPSPAGIPDGPRWVQLTEGLIPDCNQALQETSNGAVTGTRVLASDGSKQRWFYVRLQGAAGCDAATLPMQGILKKADTALPAWLKDKGISAPASAFPLMEISANEGPDSVKMLLWIFAGMGALGLITIAVFAKLLKQSSVRRPLARSAGIGH
jgi:hypothetical protein